MTGALISRSIIRTLKFAPSRKGRPLRSCWHASVPQDRRRLANEARWTWTCRVGLHGLYSRRSVISRSKAADTDFRREAHCDGIFRNWRDVRTLYSICARPCSCGDSRESRTNGTLRHEGDEPRPIRARRPDYSSLLEELMTGEGRSGPGIILTAIVRAARYGCFSCRMAFLTAALSMQKRSSSSGWTR